jgi:pyruvate ferredoxin oxidoreductase gamma subunit
MSTAYEVRLHGIGGQGVAAAADLLGLAAVKDGRWAHSFPFFGTEIRGGVVTAFTRISNDPIHTRSFIYDADMIVVFAGYLVSPEILKGIKENTILLVNSAGAVKSVPSKLQKHLRTIDADGIARSIPGCRIANGGILGAIAGLSKQVSLESVEASINDKFNPEVAGVIIQSVRLGYKAACEGIR